VEAAEAAEPTTAAASEAASAASLTATTATGSARSTWEPSQVPGHTVHARLGLCVQFTGELAGEVDDLQFDLFRFLADRIENGRTIKRVVADDLPLGAVEHAAIGLDTTPVGSGRSEQVSLRFDHVSRDLPQRHAVEHPNASAVRGDDQVAGRRVLGDFVDRNRRQVIVRLRPGTAAVGGHIEAELRTDVENILILNVFTANASRTPWQAAGQRFPGGAEVLRHKDVWLVVITAVGIERRVTTAFDVFRCFQSRDPARSRKPGLDDVGRYFDPFLSTVLGHPNHAVVGAGPDNVGVSRRLAQSCAASLGCPG